MDILRFLYHTIPGRLILKPLTRPGLTRLAGDILDGPASKVLIPGFIRRNGIDMSEYKKKRYKSFNDFFCREIRPEVRPIDPDPDHLIAPCDGFLSVYPIRGDVVVPVKQSRYTISSLIRSDRIARDYQDGLCMVFRLCVNHYHRYCFPDNGKRSPGVKIDGVFHTVRPVALERYPVFTENTREYCLFKSDNFGTMVLMEVGAMLVGRIINHEEYRWVDRGQEKGYFEYGGSTVIVLVEKDRVQMTDTFKDAREVPVKMGQMIGQAIKK